MWTQNAFNEIAAEIKQRMEELELEVEELDLLDPRIDEREE